MGAFGAFRGWLRPKVVRFEYLIDAEEEKIVRQLRAKGHELHWVLVTRLPQLQRDGWKRVTQWDRIGRRSIFMDRREEIILLHRPPPRRIAHERIAPASRLADYRHKRAAFTGFHFASDKLKS